ncbi:MAG: DUF3644 domain-containing protein [Candidatus Melainabacteria bacterium]|jgi:hypothetical protein|nr:DUF3644 domain-containing protein [Candidatus Melainabacteria bacterium]
MRQRRLYSLKKELLWKSREAALCAVQIFNNPLINFKTETFIVLMVISWTYLLHAYYRENKIEYRYHNQNGKKKKFDKTKSGAFKHWELERCLNDDNCPLDNPVKVNLKFLIGLRHEIEHQMSNSIDAFISSKLQACCINYNNAIKKLFGDDYAIDKYLSYSIQFATLTDDQIIKENKVPQRIIDYIQDFEGKLPVEIYQNRQYGERVVFSKVSANHPGGADEVITFIPDGTPEAREIDESKKKYTLVKLQEQPKYKPKQIVEHVNAQGFADFNMNHHTKLWQEKNAKKANPSYGTTLGDGQWYWYKNWLDLVVEHCQKNPEKFGKLQQ